MSLIKKYKLMEGNESIGELEWSLGKKKVLKTQTHKTNFTVFLEGNMIKFYTLEPKKSWRQKYFCKVDLEMQISVFFST